MKCPNGCDADLDLREMSNKLIGFCDKGGCGMVFLIQYDPDEMVMEFIEVIQKTEFNLKYHEDPENEHL